MRACRLQTRGTIGLEDDEDAAAGPPGPGHAEVAEAVRAHAQRAQRDAAAASGGDGELRRRLLGGRAADAAQRAQRDAPDTELQRQLLGGAQRGADGDVIGEQLRRQLLFSRTTVTGLLGAPTLWAEGFKGQNVKMGVFDTGIRPDHPHVKNIRCASAAAGVTQAARNSTHLDRQLNSTRLLHLLLPPALMPARLRALQRSGCLAVCLSTCKSICLSGCLSASLARPVRPSNRVNACRADPSMPSQGAEQLDARADAGGWPGARHLCRGCDRRPGRRLPGVCARGGALHLPRVHQRPGGRRTAFSFFFRCFWGFFGVLQ
jgi:hypothetical protein